MELVMQYEVYEVINKMITKLEKKEKNKKTISKYQKSDKGRTVVKKCNARWRKNNPERCKEISNRSHNKRRQKILKAREEEDIIPTMTGGVGEIILASYKKRNWTKEEENILRECKRRCKRPYKAGMTWKAIGILLNRPQKSIRDKWRRMIEAEEEEEEIILLQPNIGVL
jgi:hypothetical protein